MAKNTVKISFDVDASKAQKAIEDTLNQIDKLSGVAANTATSVDSVTSSVRAVGKATKKYTEGSNKELEETRKIFETIEEAVDQMNERMESGLKINVPLIGKLGFGLGGLYAALGIVTKVLGAVWKVAKFAFNAIKKGIQDAVAKAKELRGAFDPLVAASEKADMAFSRLQAAIGDIVFIAVTDVKEKFIPLWDELREKVEANKEEFTKFASVIAKNLVKAVGTTISLLGDFLETTQTIFKWTGYWEKASAWVTEGNVDAALHKINKEGKEYVQNTDELIGVLRGLEGRFGQLAERVGDYGEETKKASRSVISVVTGQKAFNAVLNRTITLLNTELIQSLRDFGNGLTVLERDKAIKKFQTDVEQLGRYITRLRPTIDGVGTGFNEAYDKLRRLYHQAGTPLLLKFDNLDATQRIELLRQAFEALSGQVTVTSAKSSLFAAEFRESLAKVKEDLQGMISQFSQIGEAFGVFFGSLISGSKSTKEALLELSRTILTTVLDSVITIANAYAVETALAAAKSVAGTPFAGPVLAAIAASTTLALMRGLVSQIGMAEGGYVSGGTPNRDSVPAILMPGEYVMSQNEVQGVQKFMGNMGTSQNGTGGGGGVNNIKIEFKSEQLPNKLETTKWVKTTILPALKQLKAVG